MQRLVAVGLNLIAVSLLALHLYVRRLPPTATPIPDAGDAEAAWWGLWPATYAPGWLVAAAVLSVLALIAALWLMKWDPEADAHAEASRRHAASAPWPDRGWGKDISSSAASRNQGKPSPRAELQIVGMAASAVALIWAFFSLPIVHTRWGDAYLLNKSIAWPDPALRLTHSWQAPLDVFLHSQVWLALHDSAGWQEATPVYRLLSPLAGAGYLLTALTLSYKRWLGPAWLTFGSLVTLGLIQLFFGYIENYSFAAAAILLYLGLGLAVLQSTCPLWLAALALAFTNATHPSTIVLAPSLLYISWRVYRGAGTSAAKSVRVGTPSPRSIAVQIGLPMIAVALATVLIMEFGGHGIQALLTNDRPGGSDARWLVPLVATSTRWEYYTMFSWGHLRDFLNEQLLVAPAVLPALVWIGLCRLLGVWRSSKALEAGIAIDEQSWRRAAFPFLAIATLCYVGFTWLWNPDYGGQRDWDLFSLAAIPAVLLLVERLSRVLHSRRYLLIGALPLLVVQGLHTAAWIYQNTLPWAWP